LDRVGRVPPSPYVAHLRARLGHELLLLPSVAALPRDDGGRVLLVQNADTGEWQTVGGAVEPDEPPAEAAVREALEEVGVHLRLGDLLALLGGPDCRVVYPNGDIVSYVVAVYDAAVTSGTLEPDGEEISGVAWWAPEQLAGLAMSSLTRALLATVGLIPPPAGKGFDATAIEASREPSGGRSTVR
jgi:8-oxo-dGTP pyrophosphatase MutT (NUDIX family)